MGTPACPQPHTHNMACSSQEEQLFVPLLLLIPPPAPPYSIRYLCADGGELSNIFSCTWATVQATDLASAASVSLSLACAPKASASRAGKAQSQTPPRKEGTPCLRNETVCCKQNTFITLAFCSQRYLSKHGATTEN